MKDKLVIICSTIEEFEACVKKAEKEGQKITWNFLSVKSCALAILKTEKVCLELNSNGYKSLNVNHTVGYSGLNYYKLEEKQINFVEARKYLGFEEMPKSKTRCIWF